MCHYPGTIISHEVDRDRVAPARRPSVTAFYATWAVLASWLGIRYSAHNVYDRIMVGWSRIILAATGVRVRAVGLERLDPTRSYLFVANHTSIVDIWVLLVAIPHTFRFLAKQELSRVPILGKAMDSAGNIFIDRHNLTSAFASYDQAAALIRAGMSAMVFAGGYEEPRRPVASLQEGPLRARHPGGSAAGAALHRRRLRADAQGRVIHPSR